MVDAESPPQTIFTKIINGDIPSDMLYEDAEEDKALLGHVMLKIGDIARQVGVDEAFRVIVNNGANAGQTVFHLHFHILAGKSFSEGLV